MVFGNGVNNIQAAAYNGVRVRYAKSISDCTKIVYQVTTNTLDSRINVGVRLFIFEKNLKKKN